MALYRYAGNRRADDYTERIVLEVDEDGQATREVSLGGTVELSKAEHEHLSQSFIIEKTTKAEAEEEVS
jgi:hypothetical protein